MQDVFLILSLWSGGHLFAKSFTPSSHGAGPAGMVKTGGVEEGILTVLRFGQGEVLFWGE